jgi:hypothetical protein
MMKQRIQGAFQELILAASVAVFCTALLAPALKDAKNLVPKTQPSGAAILIADGGDPVPQPVPVPWLGAVA